MRAFGEKFELEIGVLHDDPHELVQTESEERHLADRLDTVHVPAIFGEPEDVMRKEKRRDRSRACRQLSIGFREPGREGEHPLSARPLRIDTCARAETLFRGDAREPCALFTIEEP